MDKCGNAHGALKERGEARQRRDLPARGPHVAGALAGQPEAAATPRGPRRVRGRGVGLWGRGRLCRALVDHGALLAGMHGRRALQPLSPCGALCHAVSGLE